MEQQWNVNGKSWDYKVEGHPMRFPPSIGPNGNQAAAETYWRRLQFVFDIDDPATSPHLPDVFLSSDESELIDRFRLSAFRLSDSMVLNRRWGFKFRFDANGQQFVDLNDPPDENMSGFAVTFRQCYAAGELASFSKAHKVLSRICNELPEPSKGVMKRRLKNWKKANSRLNGRQLNELVVDRLIELREAPPEAATHDWLTPKKLISIYNYGDLIHWDRERKTLEGITGGSPLGNQLLKVQFLQAVAAISHIYVGFAIFLDEALDLKQDRTS